VYCCVAEFLALVGVVLIGFLGIWVGWGTGGHVGGRHHEGWIVVGVAVMELLSLLA